MRQKLIVPFVLLLMLTACQHAPLKADKNRVAIANDITLRLLLPKNSFTATQKITARYRDPQKKSDTQQESQHTLLMQVQASPRNIVMAGLAPSGTRLFSLQFDGSNTETWRSPLFSLQQITTSSFDARFALADFELTSFPISELQAALSGNAQLSERIDAHGLRVRELSRSNGDVVMRVEYRPTETQYCHRERHYCLLIENLP